MTVVDAVFAPLFVWVVLGTEVVTGKVGAGAGGAVNMLGTGLEVSKRPAGTLDAVCTIEVVLNASFPDLSKVSSTVNEESIPKTFGL